MRSGGQNGWGIHTTYSSTLAWAKPLRLVLSNDTRLEARHGRRSSLMFHYATPIVSTMKNGKRRAPNPATERVELGQYIVADPRICHGKPTFKGTRVFVADVLADVERGLSWDFIIRRWGGGKISKAAVAEAVHLARTALLNEDGHLAALSRAA